MAKRWFQTFLRSIMYPQFTFCPELALEIFYFEHSIESEWHMQPWWRHDRPKNLTFENRILKSWELTRQFLIWKFSTSKSMWCFSVGHYNNNYTRYWHNSWLTAVTWTVVKYFVIEASISHTNKLLNYIIRILRVWPWLLKKTGSKS